MITIIYERGGGGNAISAGMSFSLFTGKMNGFYSASLIYVYDLNIPQSPVTSFTYGNEILKYNNGFLFRITANYAATNQRCFVYFSIDGNFNFDNLRITNYQGFDRRVEVRNENGVLLCDNGMPWGDGTYPQDAKNRAGLAGLHAAPAVINPELETALTGDITNKEEELTGAERGAGIQYALERNEDNGL